MISSKSNAQIKELILLQKRKKLREERGLFVVEGRRMTLEAPSEALHSLYMTQGFFNKHQREIEAFNRPFTLVSDEVFAYVSVTKTPQGILGLIKKNQYTLEDFFKTEYPFLLVLESVQDPGNLGTLFRSGEAAGVSGIIMNENCADIYGPKVVRSTMGSLYRLPFIQSENLEQDLNIIKKKGIFIYAGDLEGSKVYYEENYPKSMALLIGNEGQGLSEWIKKKADALVKIPMAGQAESLNAAVAAGILMFEVKKQHDKMP